MCDEASSNEKRILIFSALLAALFATVGLFLGLIMGSIVITFDGVYSLLSLLLTLLSLAVSRFIQHPSKRNFPFGKAILEPIVITIKASVILLVVATSLYSAVTAMFNGGRSVDAGIATIFGIINVLGCGYAWWYIKNHSTKFKSGLVEAESRQWQMDTLLSVAVTLGFVFAWILTITPLAHLSSYADPAMMILMSAYFIKVPYEMLVGAVREMLMMRPDEDICKAVKEEVSAIDQSSEQDISLVAMTKVGRELRVNLDIHTQGKDIHVADLNKTRTKLEHRLANLALDLNLTMNIAH